MPIKYMFCFMCSEKCIKSISSRKNVDLFSSVFQNIIPNNTIPTFQEVDCISIPYILMKAYIFKIYAL